MSATISDCYELHNQIMSIKLVRLDGVRGDTAMAFKLHAVPSFILSCRERFAKDFPSEPNIYD